MYPISLCVTIIIYVANRLLFHFYYRRNRYLDYYAQLFAGMYNSSNKKKKKSKTPSKKSYVSVDIAIDETTTTTTTQQQNQASTSRRSKHHKHRDGHHEKEPANEHAKKQKKLLSHLSHPISRPLPLLEQEASYLDAPEDPNPDYFNTISKLRDHDGKRHSRRKSKTSLGRRDSTKYTEVTESKISTLSHQPSRRHHDQKNRGKNEPAGNPEEDPSRISTTVQESSHRRRHAKKTRQEQQEPLALKATESRMSTVSAISIKSIQKEMELKDAPSSTVYEVPSSSVDVDAKAVARDFSYYLKQQLPSRGKKIFPANSFKEPEHIELKTMDRSDTLRKRRQLIEEGVLEGRIFKMDRDEENNEGGEHRHHHHHHRHHKRRTVGDVVRFRDAKNNVVTFRKVGGDGEFQAEDDPLLVKNINRASTFKEWRKEAQLTLPSNIGVPVENKDDAVSAGLKVLGSRRHSVAASYNAVYDEIQKKASKDKSRVSEEKGAELSQNEQEAERRSKAKSKGGDSTKESTLTKKIKAIRDLAEHLTEKRRQKRHVKRQGLKADQTRNELTFKERLEKIFVKAHRAFHDATRLITIWQTDLRKIHGKYGLGAASYFHWLRIIFFLNLTQSVLMFFLIFLPEVLRKDPKQTILVSCPTDVLGSVSGGKLCALIPHPKADRHVPWDIFTGLGFMEDVYMYYSNYKDTASDPFCPSHQSDYQEHSFLSITGFRFVMMLMLIFVINALFVFIQIKHYILKTNLESKIPGLRKNDNFRTLFYSWDFSVTDPEAADVLRKSIWRNLKNMLEESERNPKAKKFVKAKRPFFENLMQPHLLDRTTLTIHIIVNVFLVLFYSGAGAILFYAFHSRQLWAQKDKNPCSEFLETPTYLLLIPALVMTILYIGIGNLCAFVAEFESWSTQVNRNFAFIARVGLYYFLNIGIVYGYFAFRSKILIDAGLCHELYFARELYRIITFQGMLYLSFTYIATTIYDRIKRRYNPSYIRPPFDPVSGTMSVIFLHTLSGSGFFFFPFISVHVILRLVGTFYLHKRLLFHFYHLPSHVVQTSEIAAPFLFAYGISFITSTVLNLLLITARFPSSTCGPFSHYNEKRQDARYSEVFTSESTTDSFFRLITGSGMVYAFIILFSAFVYTQRVWGRAYLTTMGRLYHYLQLERKDRDFLLEAIYHFARKHSNEDFEEGGTTDERDLRPSWTDTEMVKGIFQNRRGTLGSLVPVTRFPGGSGNLEDDGKHGAVGKFLKQDFDWLPSQWKRRNRRSAARPAEITPSDLETFQAKYMKAINKDSDKR